MKIIDDTHDFRGDDAFDVALALYHWLQHNWEGQGDELYVAHCQLTEHYRPSRSEECFDKIGNDAAAVYAVLTRGNYQTALDCVFDYRSGE